MGDLTAERSDIKSLKKERAWSDEYNFPEDLKEYDLKLFFSMC